MMAGVEQPEVQEALQLNKVREIKRLRLKTKLYFAAGIVAAVAYVSGFLKYSVVELTALLFSWFFENNPLLVGCPAIGAGGGVCSVTLFIAQCGGVVSLLLIPALVNMRIRDRIEVLRDGLLPRYKAMC